MYMYTRKNGFGSLGYRSSSNIGTQFKCQVFIIGHLLWSTVPVTSVWKNDLRVVRQGSLSKRVSSSEPLNMDVMGNKRKLSAPYGENEVYMHVHYCHYPFYN